MWPPLAAEATSHSVAASGQDCLLGRASASRDTSSVSTRCGRCGDVRLGASVEPDRARGRRPGDALEEAATAADAAANAPGSAAEAESASEPDFALPDDRAGDHVELATFLRCATGGGGDRPSASSPATATTAVAMDTESTPPFERAPAARESAPRGTVGVGPPGAGLHRAASALVAAVALHSASRSANRLRGGWDTAGVGLGAVR